MSAGEQVPKSVVQTLRFQTQNASLDAPTEVAGAAAGGMDLENVTGAMEPESQDLGDATLPTRSQIELGK